MKKIKIGYWHSKIEGIKYEHLEEFEYSTKKRNEIVNYLLSKKCSVMLRPSENELIIWIDKGRFGQR